jgi:transposase
MRGADQQQGALFSVVSLEARVPADHPLRVMRALVDGALTELAPRFEAMYARVGRPSVPPEQLLRALLLQILYTVRSERLLMEQLDYNLLFRWFVGLGIDDAVWVPTTFTKNRDRLLAGDVAAAFFAAVVGEARRRGLLSDEHFTVDGTLLEAWASQKSFRPKASLGAPGDGEGPPDDAGNPTVSFHGQRRSNVTHASTTDPDARLARKGPGKEAKLSYAGHVLMDNRHGLAVGACVTPATGTAECDAALALVAALPPRRRRRTLGADKAYYIARLTTALRTAGVTPHIAEQATPRRRTLDGRTTRHAGYAESQRRRKLIEEGFGWGKTVGLLRKLRHRGLATVDWIFTFTQAAYNLVRIRTLLRVGLAGPLPLGTGG